MDNGPATYTCVLENKCAMAKFNVTTPSDAAICITGMNNIVSVDFGTFTPSFSYGQNVDGLIKMAPKNASNETWAILLPQTTVEEGDAYTEDGMYTGTRPAINGGIAANQYLNTGISMTVNTLTPRYTPLTFEAKTAPASVTFDICTSAATELVYISTNGENWSVYTSGTAVPLNNIGDKVMFQGNNATYANLYTSDYSHFSCTGECYVYGNIMSLINANNYPTATELTEEFTFANLFMGNCSICNHLTKTLALPATTLTKQCYSSMFYECTGLTTAPNLPATNLAEYCYQYMFSSCTLLETAPDLPATTLAEGCYKNMFQDCTNLTTAPELPATMLANGCYENMFLSCTSLPTAPALPATTLADDCYSDMFRECIGLATAPALPATNLATNCYSSMFADCIDLAAAPALPATTLAEGCYMNMFRNCVKLETAPILPASTLVDHCYQLMFNGCSRLNSVTCLATDISADNCTYDWLDGVAATGTFTKPALTDWTEGASGIPSGWTVVERDLELTFEAKTAGATVRFTKAEDLSLTDLEYNVYDGSGWQHYTTDTEITLTNEGDKVSFRGNNDAYATEYYYGHFVCSNCYVYGNIMSLIDAVNYPTATELTGDYTFHGLFNGQNSVYSHPTKTLVLPATTLRPYCYAKMFYKCTNLTTAPTLPATTLADNCYKEMFRFCSNLNSVTCLATTGINENNSTTNWMNVVASSGTFTKASGITWPEGASGIPSGWTVQDAPAP